LALVEQARGQKAQILYFQQLPQLAGVMQTTMQQDQPGVLVQGRLHPNQLVVLGIKVVIRHLKVITVALEPLMRLTLAAAAVALVRSGVLEVLDPQAGMAGLVLHPRSLVLV
jgi:hypothetical protein